MTWNVRPGDVVTHGTKPNWGRGIVRSVEGSKATVDFEGPDPPGRRKRLQVARLERCAQPAPTLDLPRDRVDPRELRRLLNDFLAVANKAGIETIGPRIEAVFLGGQGPQVAGNGAIERQLRRWIDTN